MSARGAQLCQEGGRPFPPGGSVPCPSGHCRVVSVHTRDARQERYHLLSVVCSPLLGGPTRDSAASCSPAVGVIRGEGEKVGGSSPRRQAPAGLGAG